MSRRPPSEAEIDLVLDRLATASTVEGGDVVVFVDCASVGPALEAFLAFSAGETEETPPCGA